MDVSEILSEEHADGIHDGEHWQYDAIGCPECGEYVSGMLDMAKAIRKGEL